MKRVFKELTTKTAQFISDTMSIYGTCSIEFLKDELNRCFDRFFTGEDTFYPTEIITNEFIRFVVLSNGFTFGFIDSKDEVQLI